MNEYKIVLWALSLMLVSTVLLSQDRQIFFENLREQEGLPYHLVTDLDQDTLGRLWVSTYNGLYVYDGYEFRGFQNNPTDSNSISSNLIRTATVDHDQRVWLGTDKAGINVLDLSCDQVRRFPSHLFSQDKTNVNIRFNHLEEDAQNTIWAATSIGLFRFKLKEDSLEFIDFPIPPDDFSESNITAIFPDEYEKIWVGTNRGLYLFDLVKNEWLNAFSSFKTLFKKRISDIIQDNEGNIWVGVKDKVGVYKINAASLKITPYDHVDDFETANRVNLCIDHMNYLWVVAGRSGVYRHNLRTKENQFFEGKDYEQEIGNFTNFTHSPLVDNFGNVWFCGGGLHKWSNTFKNFSHYKHPFGNYQSTAAIYDDDKFRITSLWGKGIVVWNKRRNTYYELKKSTGLFSDRIYAFVPYQGNAYLIGGQGGYQIVNLDTKYIRKYVKLKGTIFHAVSADNKVFIGGSRGIWEIQNDAVKSILSDVNLRYFERKNDNEFWIPSLSKGLIKWDRKQDTLFKFQSDEGNTNTLQSNRIEHLAVSEGGTIWLATGAGIESFNPKTDTWTHYNDDDHIAGIRANAIHIIGDSAVWVSNNEGISVMNLEEENWTHFRTEDGLLNTYFYERSSFVNSKGRLFFGGRLGVVHFMPQDLKINPNPPNLYFDQVRVDGEVLYPNLPDRRKISLPWDHRFFEIDFTAIQLTEPLSTTYQYRLFPVQKEWNTIKKQTLFFNGVKSGDYQLEIRAQNGDGVKASNPLVMSIEIGSPFWRQLWFFILCIGIGGFIIYYYLNYTRTKYKKLLNLERKMNEVELSALRSQMSPHFIFNTMSSIQHFIIERDEEKALKYLSTFSRIIRKILEYSNRNFIPFDEEISLLKDYVKLEQLRFGQKINFVINVSENLSPDFVHIPPMLVQPIVENAINHGLRPLNDKEKKLDVNFDVIDQSTISVQIIDNGIGRKAASLAERKDHQSTGTQIVKTRLQIVGEQLNTETLFEIIDLESEGRVLGTLVNMKLPYLSN